MRWIARGTPSFFLASVLTLMATACATPERTYPQGVDEDGRPAAFQKHELALTWDALQSLKEILMKNGIPSTNRLTLKRDINGASCKASCDDGTSQTCNATECGALDGAGCWEQGAGDQPVFKRCVAVESPRR
jgi:hypothetical protein